MAKIAPFVNPLLSSMWGKPRFNGPINTMYWMPEELFFSITSTVTKAQALVGHLRLVSS
jgi:hypothetical protein